MLGTTYVECKTGYGLEWPGELRLLKLLEQVRSQVSIGISITYCGAHAIPKYERQTNRSFSFDLLIYFYEGIKPPMK